MYGKKIFDFILHLKAAKKHEETQAEIPFRHDLAKRRSVPRKAIVDLNAYPSLGVQFQFNEAY